MKIQGKSVLITGACSGIGKIMARRCLEKGAKQVIIWDINESAIAATVAELSAVGHVHGYKADISSAESVDAAFEATRIGCGDVDILINNAGITDDAAIKRMTEAQWDNVINNDLKSVFLMTQAVQPSMWKQGFGSIVNISSVVGIGGNAGQANYAAAKAGIIGFTKSAVKELGARNIRMNVVAPGFIVTEMTGEIPEQMKTYWQTRIPLRRPGTPQEVANACLYYASELGSYNTGDVMHLCGGMEDA
jgi:3-oxoacyl-[acyl-carrier protein] reductase